MFLSHIQIRITLARFKDIKSYNAPIHDDIVVCIASFNAGEFTKTIMNNLYVINILKNSGIPYYIIELSYPNQRPTFTGDNVIHVSASSYMFHKENLFNLLVTKLPAQYTKIVCMDGDVVFSNLNWINDLSIKLDECDVVMPYHDGYQVSGDYNFIQSNGVVMLDHKSNYDEDIYKAGYCIAFKRTFFDKIGLFEYAIFGGGDRMTLCQFVGRPIMVNTFNSSKKQNYIDGIKALDLKFGWLDDDVYHLPHGHNVDRQYLERHFLIPELNIDTELVKNDDGVLEFVDPGKYNYITYKYFKNRKEDSLSL